MQAVIESVMAAVHCGVSATVALFSLMQSASADDVADFYKGKTFTIVVGHEVGTGFDIYGRTLARHIGRHILGNPNVVVQNMNGASGLTSANWLFGTLALGRVYASTPGVPRDRTQALRTAFMATARDPAFLEDAVKTQIDVSAMTGAEVEAFIARISSSSPQVIERAKLAYRSD
jgi:tripartite-type tricarboxylate transporter receptor subunit TctC